LKDKPEHNPESSQDASSSSPKFTHSASPIPRLPSSFDRVVGDAPVFDRRPTGHPSWFTYFVDTLSMSPATTCPPETWDAIIRCLPRHERQNCLSICRAIHDVAQRLLFQHVFLEFGAWEHLKPQYNDLEMPKERVLANVKRRTTDLLTHVARNPRFAQVVRQLTVHSFEMQDALEEESRPDFGTHASGLMVVLPYRSTR
jgi:hypothetical protein